MISNYCEVPSSIIPLAATYNHCEGCIALHSRMSAFDILDDKKCCVISSLYFCNKQIKMQNKISYKVKVKYDSQSLSL